MVLRITRLKIERGVHVNCVDLATITHDCKRESLWSLGPELCVAQGHNQSLFYIDEHIDHGAMREKASSAIIIVTRGDLTARQLEMEFNIIDSETSRWSVRKVNENKCVMRLPSAKMVQEYNKFNLGIKIVDAHITIEP
jgi:hypothetical protein